MNIRCNKCGQEVLSDDLFCPYCGNKIDKKTCPRCGMANENEENFCISCGMKLSASSEQAVNDMVKSGTSSQQSPYFCNECGARNAGDSEYCLSCGAKREFANEVLLSTPENAPIGSYDASDNVSDEEETDTFGMIDPFQSTVEKLKTSAKAAYARLKVSAQPLTEKLKDSMQSTSEEVKKTAQLVSKTPNGSQTNSNGQHTVTTNDVYEDSTLFDEEIDLDAGSELEIICPRCGTLNEKNRVYCLNCSATLHSFYYESSKTKQSIESEIYDKCNEKITAIEDSEANYAFSGEKVGFDTSAEGNDIDGENFGFYVKHQATCIDEKKDGAEKDKTTIVEDAVNFSEAERATTRMAQDLNSISVRPSPVPKELNTSPPEQLAESDENKPVSKSLNCKNAVIQANIELSSNDTILSTSSMAEDQVPQAIDKVPNDMTRVFVEAEGSVTSIFSTANKADDGPLPQPTEQPVSNELEQFGETEKITDKEKNKIRVTKANKSALRVILLCCLLLVLTIAVIVVPTNSKRDKPSVEIIVTTVSPTPASTPTSAPAPVSCITDDGLRLELNEVGEWIVTDYRGNLSILSIPSSINGIKVTEIGDNVFSFDSWLETVILPEGIKKIGNEAFRSCESLERLVLPDSVEVIGDEAIAFNKKLKQVHLPKCLQTLGERVFWYSPIENIDIGSEHLNFEVKSKLLIDRRTDTLIYCMDKTAENISVPNGIVEIGDYAFHYCDNLEEIRFPAGIKTIGTGAFESCEKLESIFLPDSITIIGKGAFASCYNLKFISLPEGLTDIGDGAFNSCYALKEVSLPNSLKSLNAFTDFPDGTFAYSNVEKINLASDQDTFCVRAGMLIDKKNATLLWCLDRTAERIVIPSEIEVIGAHAFGGCSDLQEVILSDGVKRIDRFAFSSCSKLKRVVFSNTLQEIGYAAFFNCTGLQSIIIPNSVTTLSERAFQDCISLQSITFSSNTKVIAAQAFSQCTGLHSIVIPEGVTTLKGLAFADCSSLKTVVLPASLNTIADNVFKGCKRDIVFTTVPDTYAEEFVKRQ